MLNRKKALLSMSLVFIYLFLTSQLHYMNISNPGLSHIRHLLRGFLDMLPLIVWFWFVKTRVIQPSVRRYLIIGSLAMQFSLFVVYLQTIIVTENINLMALSVIGITVPYFIFPVFSLLATLCLGMPEQYKLPDVYMLLPVASFVLALLAFTNYYHEGFFKFEILPDDINRSSVELGWMCYVSILFAFIVIVWRLIATKRFIDRTGNTRIFITILISFISILIYHIPYILNGFASSWELVGSTQFTFFIEILSWIICMSTGLVPVNTDYDKVFKFSSMNFELYSGNYKLVYPKDHEPLKLDVLKTLISNGSLQLDSNTILHSAPLKRKGYVVWKKDISFINRMTEEQELIKKELKEQEELLQNELTMANAREKLQQKNAIYNKIDDILKKDISYLDSRLKELDSDYYDEALYKEIIQRGIYIKRKSNLLILDESSQFIPLTELKLTMDEMLTGLYDIETDSVYLVPLTTVVKTKDIILCLDLLKATLEAVHINTLTLRIEDENSHVYFNICYTTTSGDKAVSKQLLTKEVSL